VGKLVVRYSRYAGLDLVNLFELTVFNFLTGNNDMHLKNFSLIYDEQGWHLSPAYDLLNVNLVNPADKEETALTINGKKQKLVVADFIALGRSYQLTDKQMSHVFRKFGDTSRTEEWIDRSFLSDPFKSEYVRMMRERASRLN